MKSINKILILFLFMISLSFIAIWETLQSEWMASKVSSMATSYAREVLKSDIYFENLKFNLFPPAAELNNVVVRLDKNKTNVEVNLSKLGFYFNPLDIFNTTFTIDEVVLSDGLIVIETENEVNKASNEKINTTELATKIKASLKDIPINYLSFEDVKIIHDSHQVELTNLTLENRQEIIKVYGKLSNINIEQFINKDISIDEFHLDLLMNEYEIQLLEAQAKVGLTTINLTGKVSAYLSKNINYNLKSSIQLPIESLHKYVEFRKIGSLNKGDLVVKSSIKGVSKNFEVLSDINLKNFETDFLDGESLIATVSIDPKSILVKKLQFKNRNEKLNLVREFEFYNFTEKLFVEDEVIVQAHKVELKNILKYLRKSFSMISGSIDGKIKLNLLSNSFNFSSKESVGISDFELATEDGLKIIKMNSLEIQNSLFDIVEGVFKMKTYVSSGQTSFDLEADIGNDKFQLRMPTGYIDLNTFDEVLGFKMKGQGTLSFDMYRNKSEDMLIDLEADMKEYEILGYEIEKAKSRASINLTTLVMNISQLNAVSGKSSLQSNGKLDLKTGDIKLSYDMIKMSFSELKKIMKPVLGGVNLTSNEIHGDLNMKGNITGKVTPEGIVVEGFVSGKNNYFFDEGFDEIKCDFYLENEVIKVKNLKGVKAKGRVELDLEYDIKKNDLVFTSGLEQIKLEDLFYYTKLPVNLQGQVSGYLSGRSLNNSWEVKSKLKLTKATVGYHRYADSVLDVELRENQLATRLSLFDGQVEMDSNINFIKNTSSTFNLKLDIPIFREFISIFRGIESENQRLEGEIKYKLKTRFDYKSEKFIDIESNIETLTLRRLPVNLEYKSLEPEIIVVGGNIKKWNINLRNKGNYIYSNGSGDLASNYSVTSKAKLHASLLEILEPIISKSQGDLRGYINYSKTKNNEEFSAVVRSNNLSLTTKYLPTTVTNSQLELAYENGQLDLKKFKAQLVSGFFEASGGVSFTSLVPDVNIRYIFKDAGISILKKSSLEFSGSGSLIGKTFPYTLAGDFYIQKLSIINEITDFQNETSAVTKNDIDFLPNNLNSSNGQYLNLNINVLTREPIYITNSIADVGFTGNVHVLGGEKDVRLDGKVSLAPRTNTISFKNNLFELSKGNVFFDERSKITNPELDFRANSVIGEHRVTVELLGPVQKYKFNLSSEPSLSQSDILSLIAFGYTEDLSNNLSDAQKESMTRAGVGSLIFDSFKINETLKNEFGLEVNLGTEISQVEGSYLQRSNSDGESGDGKVSSSTKVELTKKINDAMSLSVTSTVGNTSQQKQSVNLNYNINKNVSVEGVYESKSTDEVETINSDTSFGTDVKWKWSFK